MSFTEDELQAFNSILEQRLSVHRREMERVFDQRMNEYRRDLDQRLVTVQRDTLRNLSQKISELENRLDTILRDKLNTQQTRITQTITHDTEQRQKQFEGSIDRTLAAQLLGIEQLLSQQLSEQILQEATITAGVPAQLEAIEVQTELPWEDLMDVIGKILDERLSSLNEATQRSLKNMEQYLSVRLHSLRDEFVRSQGHGPQSYYNGSATTIQEVLHGIEHLERIIESMQVAMTANNALLSNRLFHHQQLPLERAHPGGSTRAMPNNGASTPLSIANERVAQGLEPGVIPRQTKIEEQKEL
jgi:uncharacterized phage infection (PIP) family protein YhgE